MAQFPSTQWSLVRDTALSQEARREAFAELAQRYQPAILAYLRGRLDTEAEDAMQAFLASSYEHAWFARADPAVGSFRGFLLLALRRHVGHWRARQRVRERFAQPEVECDEMQAGDSDPEREFDARFLVALTQQALARLRELYRARGRELLFATLLPLLSAPPVAGELLALAQRSGVAANTLAVELKRLRQRLREALRAQLANLCSDAASCEQEMQLLRGV